VRAVTVYESMLGNAHAAAEAIGDGLEVDYEVEVTSAAGVTRELVEGASLLVVGGPTRVRSMSRPRTRRRAVAGTRNPTSGPAPERGVEGPGLAERITSLGHLDARAAAFDTRLDGLALCRVAPRR